MIAKNKLPVVFVIAVILLIGFIFYRQKPTVTKSDWKTYKSTESGFEIQYPKDWEVGKELNMIWLYKMYGQDPNKFECSLHIADFAVEQFDNHVNGSINSPATWQGYDATLNDIPVVLLHLPYPTKKSALGGRQEYIIKPYGKELTQEIYESIESVRPDGLHYGIPNDESCYQIFDEMLSTFKILK